MNAKGRVFKYKDNVDTDVIIPARYLNTSDPKELASHAMEDIDPDFIHKVHPGDIIVAGKNLVIASSFARIFYRNSLNIGLAILECPDAVAGISQSDIVSVDFSSGLIKDETTGKEYRAEPFPPFMQELIKAGGLAPYIKEKF